MGDGVRHFTIPVICCAGLVLVGTALQLCLGDIDSTFLAYPWSAILALFFTYAMVLLQGVAAKHRWARMLTSQRMGRLLLGLLVLVAVVMGLTGARLQHSWPFVLLLTALTAVTGVAAIDDLFHFRSRPLGAILSHVGTYMFLLASLCGNADKRHVTVSARLDDPVHVAVDDDGRSVTLPFVLTLKQFAIDAYPPKLYLYDTALHASSEMSAYE